MRRRQFLGAVGAVGLASTAGCMEAFEDKDIFYKPEDYPYISEDKIVIHWMYKKDKEGDDPPYPNLEQQRPYMESLASDYPEKVAIIEYNVSESDQNREIYNVFRDKLNIESDGSPLTVIDTNSYVGYNQSIEDGIDEVVQNNLDAPEKAERHEDIMSQFFEVEDPEPREEPGFFEKLLDRLSNL